MTTRGHNHRETVTVLVVLSMVSHQTTLEASGVLQSKVQGNIPQPCPRCPLLNLRGALSVYSSITVHDPFS